MRGINQSSKKVYCGIDFHKNTSTFTALYQDGSEVEVSTTIRTDRLVQYFSNRRDWKLGIEASCGVNQVVEDLKSAGHEVVIFNSNQFRGIAINGKKTDERDCRALAECLRLNFVPEVHHKSRKSRELKSLLVQREIFVRTRVNMMNHVRGTLREYGITINQGAEKFYAEAATKVAELEQPLLRQGLEGLLVMIRNCKEQEAQVELAMAMHAGEDARVKRLQTVPGIGNLTALALLCVVDEINRFKNAKEFASYIGLTPKIHASGDVRMMGSITRSGPEILRRYLIHGARAWMKYAADGDVNRNWAERVKERRGMNKAVVALAHRMARIAFAVLRDESQYKGRAKKVRGAKKAA